MSEGANQPINDSKPWSTDEGYWTTLAPIMFDERRWADAPGEVDQAFSLLGVAPGAAVLDLFCGPGRHSLALARRGYLVTGVDRKAEYLQSATAQAERDGLNAEFVRADMRQFCRPDGFDAVLNLYSSFGYFEGPAEDRQVLLNVHRSLRSGGTLLVELVGKETLARDFQARIWQELEDGALLLQERRISQSWTWFERRWILLKHQKQQEFRFGMRVYSAAELSSLLVECGFRPVEVYGDLTGAPYDEQAKRLVVVAHR